MRIIERFSAPLLFFLLATFAIIVSVYKPYYNWDIIGYIAAAKSFEEQDIESLHSFTYAQLRNSLSAEKYEELAQEKMSGHGHSSYRHSISTDPSTFKEQLPFYQIRLVYTSMIYLLYKTGVDIILATHLISGIAVAVAIPFLYLMSVSFLSKPFIYTLPPLAIIFGILDLARYSTPDGLAFLALIVFAYLYLKARINLLLILLPIIVGIRTDFILFVIPLLFFIFVLNKCNVWKTALSTFMSVAIYLGVRAYWGSPSWSTSFYFILVQIFTHPISMPPTLTVQDYFFALLRGTGGLISKKAFILYMIMAAYSFYLIKINTRTKSVVIAFKSSPFAVLAVVCFFFVVSHFLAFPVAWDRFFSGPYLIGAFSLLSMMTDYLKSSHSVQ